MKTMKTIAVRVTIDENLILMVSAAHFGLRVPAYLRTLAGLPEVAKEQKEPESK